MHSAILGAGGGASIAYVGSALGGFSVSNTLISAVGQVIDFRPGHTLWLVFQSLGTSGTTTETLLACKAGSFSAGKGFWLTRAGDTLGAAVGQFYLLAANNNILPLGAANAPSAHGITVICLDWRASDGMVSVSINGGALTATNVCACVAPDSTCQSYIGSPESGLGSIALTSGRILAAAVWSAEATGAEAAAGTFTTGNRFQLPAAVTGDARCTFNFVASRDFANGAASCTTLGSSPVTFAVTGAPVLTPVAERRYTRLAYLDSKRAEAQVDGAGVHYTRRDSYARIRVVTDGLYVSAATYSTMNETFAPQCLVGLYRNGVFVRQTRVVDQATPRTYNLQLTGGSAQVVEVWEGEQNLTGGTDRVGTFVTDLRVPLLLADGVTNANTGVPSVSAVQHRFVLLGDSILTGFYATTPMQGSLTPLMRADFPSNGTGGVTCFSAGTESIHNVASSPTIAAAWAALVIASCDGTVTNRIWVELGTNDYGFLQLSAATFATEYARAIAALMAAGTAAGIPGLTVYLQSPFQRIAPSSEAANASGSTLPEFRAVIPPIAALYPGVAIYIDGGGEAIVSDANMWGPDGVHFGDGGFTQAKAFIKTTSAY